MEHILGQESAIRTLQGALDSGRVHHAWIFQGPPGVGKFTTALAFAKHLLDPDAVRDLSGHVSVDPASRISRLVDEDNHPDLHIIRKELALYSENKLLQRKKQTNIPIDLLREHMIGGITSDDHYHEAPAFQTPTLGHGKVFIIDEAELLDPTGQNALLKTLEEPPRRTYIILVTTHPEELLPTIRSRAQRVTFTPLSPEAMNTWIERSGLDVSSEARAWIESFADGSPGMARMAVEGRLFEWRNEIVPMLRKSVTGRYPVELGDTLAGFVDAFAETWVKEHENASKEMAKHDGARRLFMLLAAEARRGLHHALDKGASPERWLDIFDAISGAERAIDRNVNLKHVFENLAAQWTDTFAFAEAGR